MAPTRRAFVCGTLSLAIAAATGRADAAPSERLALFLRMKADLAGRPAPIAYRADIFLRSNDDIMKLLARVEGLSWTQVLARGRDRFEVRQIDAGRYLDPASLTPLAELRPPGAASAYRVKPYRTPGSYVATPASIEAPALARRADVKLALDRSRPFVMDDEIWATEDLQTTFAGTAAGRVEIAGAVRRRVSQFTTFVAPANAVATDATSLPATAHAIIVTDSRPWLPDLSDPLPLLWRMTGRKLHDISAAPRSTRAWLAEAHPDLLQAPWR